jgi:HAD superfamily hydrolase (TIGR01509 family)
MPLAELVPLLSFDAWAEFESGAIDEATFERRFFRDGRAYDHRGLVDTLTEAYRWLPGMEALVRDLAAAGIEMHVLSNYPPWYRIIDHRLGISRYMPWTFVSCQTGVRKPAPEAFAGPLRALARDPADVLFVDDREANCDAARALGICSIRFESADALRTVLRKRCGQLLALS